MKTNEYIFLDGLPGFLGNKRNISPVSFLNSPHESPKSLLIGAKSFLRSFHQIETPEGSFLDGGDGG